MKTYSNVLLQTCIADLFISFLTAFTIVEAGSSNGRLFLRVAVPIYGYYPCFGIWLYLIALTTVYCDMFVQPLFRYFLIVRNTTLSPTKTWILYFVIIFFGALMSVDYASSFCRNDDSTFNTILRNISPWKFEETSDGFRSRDLTSLNVIIYICSFAIVASISNSIFIFCTYKIVKSLKLTSSIYSKQTLKMHKELNRKSLYQMILPIISSIILLITCVIVLLKLIENSGIILISLMAFQYITVFNPIITILTIQCYRNAFIKKKIAVKTISISKTGISIIPIPLPLP